MKKRIFHFVKSNNLSGLENVVINICTLVKGYDYTYVSQRGPIEHILKYYGIKHITIPKLTPLNILNIIRKYNPDIVQAHDERVTVLMAPSYFYCHRHGIKMISELHNNDPKTTKWWQFRSIIYLFSTIFYNKIISVSQDILNNYVYTNFIKHKVKVIPNIINPYRVRNNARLNVSKKWDCIFLGRLVSQKNPLKFVKIIKCLKQKKPNITAVVVGSGNLAKRMKALVLKYRLVDNFRFVGFQSNPYKFLSQSKVLIITSRFEGFCLVALEALALGVPVVSTPLNVIKTLLGLKCAEFSRSNDNFAKKIYKLLIDKKEYKYKKIMGFKRLNCVNNVGKFIKSYKNVYEKKL